MRLVELKTTSETIARTNLNGKVDDARRRLKASPGDDNARATLVALLLDRSRYYGTYRDFDELLSVAEAGVKERPDSPMTHFVHAKVLGALHRFDEALAALGRSEELDKLNRLDVASARETILLARQQDVEEVIEARRARLEKGAIFGTRFGHAAALEAAGKYRDADARFVEAAAKLRDPSPYARATVAFTRGVMWGEQADQPAKACTLYHHAVKMLPGFVVANVHLAELEAEAGATDAAIARLKPLVDATDDPEPAGLLGEIVAERDAAASARYVAAAKKKYDELLEKYELAFADHGAEFFMGPGDDPRRALALAQANLDNRPSERALQLAIEAAEHAGDQGAACGYVARVDAPHRVALKTLAARLRSTCPAAAPSASAAPPAPSATAKPD